MTQERIVAGAGLAGSDVAMKSQEIRVDERVSAKTGPRGCGETGTGRGRVNPRVVGTLDALVADGTPADRREDIPFDGLDRLAYWQARKEAESNAGRQDKGRAQSRSARGPDGLTHDATAGILLRRARDEFGSVPRASGAVAVPSNTRADRRPGSTKRPRDQARVQS